MVETQLLGVSVGAIRRPRWWEGSRLILDWSPAKYERRAFMFAYSKRSAALIEAAQVLGTSVDDSRVGRKPCKLAFVRPDMNFAAWLLPQAARRLQQKS